MTALDDLRAAVAAIRALGPTITRVDLTQAAYDQLKATTQVRMPWYSPIPGTVSTVTVDLNVVDDLPAGAYRFHWSDGRITPRYRIVIHPWLVRVAILAKYEPIPLTVVTRSGALGSWLPWSGEDAGQGPIEWSPWWPGRGQMTFHGLAERRAQRGRRMRTQDHGNNAYTDDRRCRCPECRTAHRQKNAERRAKAYAHTREHGLPEGVKHGSSAYDNWGCRCEICTSEATEKRAARAARKRHSQR